MSGYDVFIRNGWKGSHESCEDPREYEVFPHCRICGEILETVYYDSDKNPVGCNNCIESYEAEYLDPDELTDIIDWRK